MEISNSDDIFDSRDLLKRIAELEGEPLLDDDLELLKANGVAWPEDEAPTTLEEVNEHLQVLSDGGKDSDYSSAACEAEELITLRKCASDMEDVSGEMLHHGATAIRDSYFKEYAEQLADDIGAIDSNAGWPLSCIDWDQAARELQQDYSTFDFDGVTYWVRS